MSSPPSHAHSLNAALLSRLREAGGRFVPLDVLGGDPSRVHDELDALAGFGFSIERHPYLGASYRGPAARLCPDQIEHELGTRRIGRRVAVWNRVGSTSDVAARAATNLSNDGLVVLAEEQTAGRGQRGRSWSVPVHSSILLSVLLFPPDELMATGQESAASCGWMTALGAVATAELVSDWTSAEARIKWPNDVRVEGRKIAGVLVERVRGPASGQVDVPARRQGLVIGIGLNGNIDAGAFPAGLRSPACSLSMLAGAPVDRSDVARDLIRRLDAWYAVVLSQGIRTLSDRWRDRSEHLGRSVRLGTPAGPLVGRLVDLDLRDGLALELSGASDGAAELKRVGPGEVLSLEC